MSKAFAMTGWRIGYCAAPTWLASACDKVQGQMTSGCQYNGSKSFYCSIGRRKRTLSVYDRFFPERRDLVYNLMKEIPGFKVNKPKSAFYIFLKFLHYIGKTLNGKEIKRFRRLCNVLIRSESKVACVGGVSFGAPECIRFSYASSEADLIEAAKRMKETLSKY